MPQLSVVIPAFNPGAGLLERAIESVLSQDRVEMELIVVDDGSREPLTWVDQHSDTRVRYLRQENAGVSVARNTGVAAATADWIAFLDQDDEWLPGKAARQVAACAASPGAAFHYTAFDWVLPSGTVPSAPVAISYRGLLADQHVCLSSVVVSAARYRRVGGHDPLLRNMQDYDLFLKLCLGGSAPVGIDESLVRYHVHGANVSGDYATTYVERAAILAGHARRAKRLGDDEALRAIRRGKRRARELAAYQGLDASRAQVSDGKLVPALAHGLRSARMDPVVATRGIAVAARRRVLRIKRQVG